MTTRLATAGSGDVLAGMVAGLRLPVLFTARDALPAATADALASMKIGSTLVIGGTTAAARNVISGNGFAGIVIEGAGATGNQVRGNYIGTSASGTSAIPNGQVGITIESAPGNTIGGTTAGTGTLISGQQVGAAINGAPAIGNVVAGNLIGVDVTGATALPNEIGVAINDGASSNVVGGTTAGARNILSGNTADGVLIQGFSAPYPTNNLVQGNYIGLNMAGIAAVVVYVIGDLLSSLLYDGYSYIDQ